MPVSYFAGITKARTQREFWVTDKSVAFQIDKQNYMMLGCDILEDEEGNRVISINPNQMEILGASGLVVEKKGFDVVNID
ncbi:MAG: hypothetical protein J1E64_10980 [Acetatifactor sp.]|nr:hypothetical protein [Acetatifactor sp.]